MRLAVRIAVFYRLCDVTILRSDEKVIVWSRLFSFCSAHCSAGGAFPFLVLDERVVTVCQIRWERELQQRGGCGPGASPL